MYGVWTIRRNKTQKASEEQEEARSERSSFVVAKEPLVHDWIEEKKEEKSFFSSLKFW